jgi:hypothetical protein
VPDGTNKEIVMSLARRIPVVTVAIALLASLPLGLQATADTTWDSTLASRVNIDTQGLTLAARVNIDTQGLTLAARVNIDTQGRSRVNIDTQGRSRVTVDTKGLAIG